MIEIEQIGTISDALRYVKQYGGQLIKSRSGEITTVLRGNYCVRFYHPDYDRELLWQTACNLGFDPHSIPTDGKLLEKFLKNIINLKIEGTYFGPVLRESTKNGYFWGYFHHRPHETQDLIELDVRSAYLRSLLACPSFLFHEPYSWREEQQPIEKYIDNFLYQPNKLSEKEYYAWQQDGGALKRLAQYQYALPKSYRLKLLGMIASHQFSVTYQKDGALEQQQVNRIKWGAAFNAVQIAVYRLYFLCREVVEIAGEYCLRWHTDGGVFRADMPREIEDKIVETFTERGFELRCKGVGKGKFWDLNTGFLGAYGITGPKAIVTDMMRQEGLSFRRKDLTPELVERWWHFLCTHTLSTKLKNEKGALCTKAAYGYFQQNYKTNEEGILEPDGGIFYCFCCRLEPKISTLYVEELISQEQAEKILTRL